MLNILKTYISPTYKEAISQGRKEKRRANDFELIFLFTIYVTVCLWVSLYYRLRFVSLFNNIDPNVLKYRNTFRFLYVEFSADKVLDLCGLSQVRRSDFFVASRSCNF